jgi:ABC-type glycerol-3-phosphate transport system permease component
MPLGIIGSAFAIFLLANVMNHIPASLAEAAEIDGANKWQVMWKVVLPLMTPTVLTVALLLFVNNWNEYLLTLLLLPDTASQTVPLAISMVNYGQFGGAPGELVAAASVLAALPSLLVFSYGGFMKKNRKKSTDEGNNLVWSTITEAFGSVLTFISHLFH